MRRSSSKITLLVLGLLLLVGSASYLLIVRHRARNSPESVYKTSGPTQSKDQHNSSDSSVTAHSSTEVKKPPRVLLAELLKRHAGDAFLAEREFGIPFDSPDSHSKSGREFWSFISELKLCLGDEAVPTLRAIMDEAESTAWKNCYLCMIVALKDPGSEPMLATWSKDVNLPISQRMIAIYGLGEIGTPSSWQTFQEIWPDIKRGKLASNLLEDLRWGAFAAMSAFGKQGAPMLLDEVRSLMNEGHADICWIYLNMVHGADPGQLVRLAKEGPTQNIRNAAIVALGEDLASPQSLNTFLDLMLHDANPQTRQRSMAQLTVKLRMGSFTFKHSPEALQQILSGYQSLPTELQLALHLDPAASNLLPDTLGQFAAAPAIASSEGFIRYLVGAGLASDPSTHSLLARQLLEHWEQGILAGALETFNERGTGFTDPELAATLAKMATDLSFTAASGQAWEILSKGPPDVRQEALRRASAAYWEQSENDKVLTIDRLRRAGPDAGPVLLELLKQESFPLPRMELASALLASGQASGPPSPELRANVTQALSPVLSGESDAGIRYINQTGSRDSLDKFAALVRDYYSKCGSSAQIPEIKSFPDRLFIPQEMIDGDPENVTMIRDKLREVILQSVDEIRRRESQ